MTKLEPEEIKAVLAEYKMNNCDVSFRCDATLDELIDAIEGNRIYMPCICECALEQAYPGPYQVYACANGARRRAEQN